MNESVSPADLWQRAQASENGIRVSTNDPKLLRDQLYRFKYAIGDITLNDYEIVIPEGKMMVCIIPRGKRNG